MSRRYRLSCSGCANKYIFFKTERTLSAETSFVRSSCSFRPGVFFNVQRSHITLKRCASVSVLKFRRRSLKFNSGFVKSSQEKWFEMLKRTILLILFLIGTSVGCRSKVDDDREPILSRHVSIHDNLSIKMTTYLLSFIFKLYE